MAMTPEARRLARLQKIENGLCAMEGCQEAAVAGKRKCQKHLDRDAANATRRNHVAAESGKCPRCKKLPSAPGRVYCQECLDECNELNKANYRKDPSKQKAGAARWYRDKVESKKCPQCNIRDAEPGHTNCAECRAYHRKGSARRQAERKRIVLTHYGTKCVGCDEADIEVLQIDHIGGGGNKHRREIGQSRLYDWLIKNNFPPGFRVLCPTCNIKAVRGITLPNEHKAAAQAHEDAIDASPTFDVLADYHDRRRKDSLPADIPVVEPAPDTRTVDPVNGLNIPVPNATGEHLDQLAHPNRRRLNPAARPRHIR